MSQQIPGIPPGTAIADLVTALNDRIRRINLALSETATPAPAAARFVSVSAPAAPAASPLYGTHNDRKQTPTSSIADGAMWFETDRTVWYQFQAMGVSAGSWRYVDGTCSCTQAALPADLGPNDAGFLANVTDYAHVLAWSGSAWQAGPNWDTPCYIRSFMVDPNPTTGWKLCDGNGDDGNPIGPSHPVRYLKPDGTLGSITSATVAPCCPNLVGSAAFLQFGSAASGINAAVAPTLTMNSYTPAGTVSQPNLAMNSYTPAGTVTQPTIVVNSQTLTTVANLAATGATTGVTQASHAHTATSTTPTFSGTSATLTGTVSQPTFTGTAATLTGTVSSTGTPPSITARPWFRK